MSEFAKPPGYDWHAWQEGRAYGRSEGEMPLWMIRVRAARYWFVDRRPRLHYGSKP